MSASLVGSEMCIRDSFRAKTISEPGSAGQGAPREAPLPALLQHRLGCRAGGVPAVFLARRAAIGLRPFASAGVWRSTGYL
eukprot:14555627-Alexandrium_andersonii.AAC.1